jgi:hypothetical protein
MAAMNKRQLWIRRVEARCGISPLDFKMARYIELLNISNMHELLWSFTIPKSVYGIGVGTINKLKALAGIEVTPKRVTWKQEALRLYALLDAAGVEYIKQR